MKKIFAIALLLCTALAFADNRTMERFAIPTARSNGMGGTHVAYTDNVFSLLVNPAAMMRVEQKSYFSFSGGLFNVETTSELVKMISSFANAISADDVTAEMAKALGETADFLSKRSNDGKISLGFDLREGLLSMAWVANGFGFAVWDRFFTNPNIIGEHIVMDAYADIILPFGFAFKILDTDAHSVDMGFTVKPFFRGLMSEKLNIWDLVGGNTDSFDSVSIPLIIGAGFDLGFMYRWDLGLSAGLTFCDIGNTRGNASTAIIGDASGTYSVPFSMNMGVAYDFRLGKFLQGIPDFLTNFGIMFAFDWHDFTNAFQQDDYTRRNSALDIGLGLQLTMFKDDLFKLRIGMNECLPSFGFGFDIGSLELDFAYYGKELGREPGQLPVAVMEVTLAIRPQAKKRDWPWTRYSAVGLIDGFINGGEREPAVTVTFEDEEEEEY